MKMQSLLIPGLVLALAGRVLFDQRQHVAIDQRLVEGRKEGRLREELCDGHRLPHA